MRKLYCVCNNGLADIQIDNGIVLHPGDTLKIIKRHRPVVTASDYWFIECSITVERTMVEDWEKGYSITRAKECKRV